ncbi:MAG: ABC transporter ATP-binding protein [Candidatus Omnitrophota bacterium]
MNNPLLQVRDLRTYFYTDEGVTKAVDGISFALFAGKVLGLIGESGCGKSVTALSIVNLVPKPGRIVGGSVTFRRKELLALSPRLMRNVRGTEISMIFQDPFSSLDPVFTVGCQVEEAFRERPSARSKARRKTRAVELLRSVEIRDAERVYRSYPHTLSGGLRQRAMLAIALANDPSVLIADEPTTALDVTVQKEILELLGRIRRERGMAVLLITHNFGIIAALADHVAVMYAGLIVEYAEAGSIFTDPLHPYTRGLMDAVPRPGKRPLPGMTRRAAASGSWSCPFYPRCADREKRCVEAYPPFTEERPAHFCACWRNRR